MANITNEELIAKTLAVINPKRIGEYVVGDVGCALLTEKQHLYLGVCIDVSSGIGFCAEHSAIAAMITAGEYKIQKIVAAWQGENQSPHILPPCGRCREFIHQIHPDNLATEVILGKNLVVRLAELLPYHNWFNPL